MVQLGGQEHCHLKQLGDCERCSNHHLLLRNHLLSGSHLQLCCDISMTLNGVSKLELDPVESGLSDLSWQPMECLVVIVLH